MGRIRFLSPFVKTLISGGIKVTYLHAELLRELGFDAAVYQPEGAPVWLSPRLQALACDRLSVTADDILVFPEILSGSIAKFARVPAWKVVFCQNHFYLFSFGLTAEAYARSGFHDFIVPGDLAKRALNTVLGLSDVAVVPHYIDPALFFPRDKQVRIATAPRKFPAHDGIPAQAALIRSMLSLKYPHLDAVPWDLLESKSENEVADSMGHAAVFLSLSRMETLPLTPLEAMASGCVVVGHHGSGGLEYATPENGFWFSPEQIEETVDALAAALDGVGRSDPNILAVRDAGIATAARFNREQAKSALRQVYGELLRA
jgi:glycosyltransferase involved in cell wall biosynthesis